MGKKSDDKTKAKVKVYTDGGKANGECKKAVTDYQVKYIDEKVVTPYETAIKTKPETKFEAKDFAKVVAQYRKDYLTAEVAQAQVLIALYTGDDTKKENLKNLEAYQTELKKEVTVAQANLEAAGGGGALGWIFGILAAVGAGV